MDLLNPYLWRDRTNFYMYIRARAALAGYRLALGAPERPERPL